jgi:hypothetical protein
MEPKQLGFWQPAGVKVRLSGGGVEEVSVMRAARLIAGGQAEPEGTWTKDQASAVLRAHETREQRQIDELRASGDLVTADSEPIDWQRRYKDLFTMFPGASVLRWRR